MLTLIRDIICLVQKHCDVFDRDQDEYVQELREKYHESEVATEQIRARRQAHDISIYFAAPERRDGGR